MLKAGLTLAIFLLALLLSSCVAPGRYTSLDLDLLPCEAGESPKFFQALEFDENGGFLPVQPESQNAAAAASIRLVDRVVRNALRGAWHLADGRAGRLLGGLVHGSNQMNIYRGAFKQNRVR